MPALTIQDCLDELAQLHYREQVLFERLQALINPPSDEDIYERNELGFIIGMRGSSGSDCPAGDES